MRPRQLVTIALCIEVATGSACASAPAKESHDPVLPPRAGVLPAGRWSGWVKPEKEPSAQVTYDVTVTGASVGIRINGPDGRSFTFRDVKLNGDTLTFIWPLLRCALTRAQGGAFQGSCALPDGSDPARMVMIPPA